MRRTTLFRILTLLYIAAVAVLCFAKFSSLPSVPGFFLGIPMDKIVHFLMFLPFPVLALFSFRLRSPKVLTVVLLVVGIFAVGCIMAWCTEIIQGRLPYRTMDPNDFAADRLGLVSGALIAFIISLFTLKKADA